MVVAVLVGVEVEAEVAIATRAVVRILRFVGLLLFYTRYRSFLENFFMSPEFFQIVYSMFCFFLSYFFGLVYDVRRWCSNAKIG